MIVARGKYELRGWYVALVAVWLLTGLPVIVILGIGFAGLAGFAMWMALNAVLLAPLILAPYGVKRTVAP